MVSSAPPWPLSGKDTVTADTKLMQPLRPHDVTLESKPLTMSLSQGLSLALRSRGFVGCTGTQEGVMWREAGGLRANLYLIFV